MARPLESPGYPAEGTNCGANIESDQRLPDIGSLRVLAVLNPHSSNYKGAVRQFEALQELGISDKTDRVDTAADRRETAARLGRKLTRGSVEYHAVLTLTGDGGSNAVGQSLHGSNDERLRTMPVIFGAGGGACDLHAMTQKIPPDSRRGKWQRDFLSSIPGQSVRTIYPMELQVGPIKGTPVYTETAFAYISLGNLGRVAHAVNGERHRASPWLGRPVTHELQEFLTAAQAVNPMDRFYIGETDGSKRRLVSDVIMTAGQRMGRREWFPGDIFKAGYFETVAPNFASVVAYAGMLATRQSTVMAPRMVTEYLVQPRFKNRTVLVQYDGETFRMPTDLAERTESEAMDICKVSVHVSDRPLYVAAGHTGDGAE